MTFSKKNIVFNIIPAIIISLLFVTPFVVSDVIYNGIIMAKEFWFFGVVELMLLYFALNFLLRKEPAKLSLNLPDILLLVFFAWCYISVFYANYTSIWYSHKLQILTGCVVVYCFVRMIVNIDNIAKVNNINDTKTKLKASFTDFTFFLFLLSGLFQAVYGLLQLYGIFKSHNPNFKVTGSFINPAPFALYLAMIFPIAIGSYLANRKEQDCIRKTILSYLSIITILTIALILPATGCRAAWIGAITGSIIVLLYKYSIGSKIKKVLDSKLKYVIVIFIGIMLFAGLGYFLYNLKKDSADGRILIYQITLAQIKDKPIVGVGLGRFEVEYNKWQGNWFAKGKGTDRDKMLAGTTISAFNEYLELFSETGIIGLILFLLIIIQIICVVNANNTIIISGIVAIFVSAFFSYPFLVLPIYISLFLLIAVNNNSSKLINIDIQRLISLLIGIVLLTLFVIIGIFQYQKYQSYRIWNRASLAFNYGEMKKASSLYKEAYPFLMNNGEFLMHYGKCLVIENDFAVGKNILEQAKEMSSDPFLYLTLADCNKGIEDYISAERDYIFTMNILPSKMYPRYQLAKMYLETGQMNKAIIMAKIILKMPIKITSPAVVEIQNEMKKILLKYNNGVAN